MYQGHEQKWKITEENYSQDSGTQPRQSNETGSRCQLELIEILNF